MTATEDVSVPRAELIAIAELRPHPQNYREHPEDQREHIARSLREHGFYRNVIAARDGTILAGHGVVAAASELGMRHVPVVKLDVEHDSLEGLKILTGDNEISRLALIDDRQLSELLREIREADIEALLGTGFDEAMLANLVYVTRPSSEIGDRDDASFWVGMPEYEQRPLPLRLMISFDKIEDRNALLEQLGITDISQRQGATISCWWPPRERDDPISLRFE